jgi:small subunit ribosomal protein S6
MRTYEELFILKPDVTDDAAESVVEQIRQTVAANGGAVDKVDKWGLRRLAYKVAKHGEGYYILVVFSAGPDAVKEIERRLRVNDLVMKYLTVRIDEKLKWLEKRKKIREKRAARKPQIQAPPPAAAVPAMPAAPPAAAPGMPAEPAPVEEPAATE